MSDAQDRPKRRKLNHEFSSVEIPEQLNSVKDLRSALLFRQNQSSEVKFGIAKFKEFLQSIVKPENASSQLLRLEVLKSYCVEQDLSRATNPSCFSDLISSWSFAVEVGHESLLSSVPSVLALFLKTISSHLEFRDLGLGLCKFLLEKDQVRLLDRGLTAAKTKGHLISPCIRLMTEIVGFDGGSVASRIFANRSITFKRMDLFLEQRKSPSDTAHDTRDKPTLRRIAQRYVLRNLAFQSAAIKRELFTEGKLLRVFLQGIRYDDDDIIADIIQAVEKHVIDDKKVPRSIKARFFDSRNLHSLATLYRSKPSHEKAAIEPPIPRRVHELLLKVCTDASNGLLMRQSGLYPPGLDPNVSRRDESSDAIDMGLDSLGTNDRPEDSPITNFKLSRFIQSLRPDSDALQGELILAIFQVAPELVANYFSLKSNFSTDPKPTPEWLGQSAWLFHCIRLPIPPNWGWDGGLPSGPPPVSILLENILPRPLDRTMLTRCMNLNVEVVTLFATRSLIVAFQKLRDVMKMLIEHSTHSSLWLEAVTKLKTAFGQRTPLTKDVIAVFQRNTKGIESLRSSAIELIASYYELLPELAMSETFNISSALSDALSRLSKEQSENAIADSLEELSTLLKIAIRFPQMKWWNRLERHNLTCFVSILQAMALKQTQNNSVRGLKHILHIVAQEHGILGTSEVQMDILIASVQTSTKSPPLPETIEFLDNCLTRLAKAPVHYQDLVCQFSDEQYVPGAPDPLIAAIVEQWPFVSKRQDKDCQKDLATWTVRFFGGLVKHEATQQDMRKLQKWLTAALDSDATCSIIRKAFKNYKDDLIVDLPTENNIEGTEEKNTVVDQNDDMTNHESDMLQTWRSKLLSQLKPLPRGRLEPEDLGEAIADGRLNNLINNLCSQQEDVRLQALSDLSRFGHYLQQGSNPGWGPLAVLVGEIVETAKSDGLETPFPSALAEMGTKFAEILSDPSHFMYSKVNRFLNKGPVWVRRKALSYWIDRVILRDSEGDDSKVNGIAWLLGILVHGLRTSEDLELYRHASVFERVISLYHVAVTKDIMRESILELIFRTIEVGGSQMLATRTGILTWLKIEGSAPLPHQVLIQELLRQVLSHYPSQQLEEWKGTAVGDPVRV